MVNRSNIEKRITTALQPMFDEILEAIENTVNSYLDDLKSSMGATSGKYGWAPLVEADEQDDKFWFKTGKTEQELYVAVSVKDNKITAKAGLPSSSDRYQIAIWNEFGWHVGSVGKLVKRPLFIPLADQHLAELNVKLANIVNGKKLHIRIKI